MRLAIADYLLRQPEDQLCDAIRITGLDGLELTYGPVAGSDRPWFQGDGPSRLREQASQQGVTLASLSVTYLWWHRIFEATPERQQECLRLLQRLVDQAADAGVKVIHLPCFDAPTPRETEAIRKVLDLLHPVIEHAAHKGATLAFEPVWPAEDAHRLVARVGNRAFRLAYDLGNALAAGREIVSELTLLGEDVVQIRVKDRARLEPFTSVRLGEGGVSFEAVLRTLEATAFDGWFILTTPSGEDPLNEARRNGSFLRRLLAVTSNSPGAVTEREARKAR